MYQMALLPYQQLVATCIMPLISEYNISRDTQFSEALNVVCKLELDYSLTCGQLRHNLMIHNTLLQYLINVSQCIALPGPTQ